jgi:hypothetical protein
MNNTNTTSSWEEKKQELHNQSEKTIGSEQNYTIIVTEHLSVKTEWIVIGDQKKRIRHCPKCNKMLIYESKRGYFNSKKKKSLCSVCATGERLLKFGLTLPSKKGVKLTTEHRKKIGSAVAERHRITPHPMLGKKHSEETINLLKDLSSGKNNAMYGKNHTMETRMKISETRKRKKIPGPKISEEAKQKLRIKRIQEISKDKYNGHQIIPSYNKKSCKFFEKMETLLGWNGFFATKNREYHVKELGYFLDYYEPKKNIVLEWDENHHFNPDGTLKEEDVVRQKEIQTLLGCKFYRIREKDFDERLVINEIQTL